MILEFDRNYGVDKRTGWSVAIGGSYYVQFWPEPVTAVLIAIWRAWRWRE
jgi:hypothetical protein